MTKKPDFGPVISQIEIKIKKNTTSTNLYKFMIKKFSTISKLNE